MKLFPIENHILEDDDISFSDENLNLTIKASISKIVSSLTIRRLSLMFDNKDIAFLKRVRDTLKSFIEKVMSKSSPENTHGLIMIRCHPPSDKFDEGRWHHDGPYFWHGLKENECVWKYAATFVGAGTLFQYKNKIIQGNNKQGAAWKVGCGKDATLHSEPPFDAPRIFCSLLPCTKMQCKEIWPDNPWLEMF